MRPLAAIALSLVAACGTRTGLDAAAGDAAEPDAAADAGAAPDAAPACTWRALGPAERVSGEPIVPGDVALMDAVPSLDGALIAWRTEADAKTPSTIVLRRVAADPTKSGYEHEIFRAKSAGAPPFGVALAVGHGRAGAVASLEGHCAFRSITVDGASNGGADVVDTSYCLGLASTARGFDLLAGTATGGGWNLILRHPLDGDGVPSGIDEPLFDSADGVYGAPARASFDDDAFLLVTSFRETLLVARAFGADGVQRGAEQTLDRYPDAEKAWAVAPTRAGAIVVSRGVWQVAIAEQTVARVVDREGAPTADRVELPVYPYAPFALATDPSGGALVAWPGAPSEAYVLPIDEHARPRGDRIPLNLASTGAWAVTAVRVVMAGTDAFVIFEAFEETAPKRIYAAHLACE